MLSNDEMNMLDSSFKQICSINSKVDTFVHENADFSHDQNWAKIAPAIDIIARKPN